MTAPTFDPTQPHALIYGSGDPVDSPRPARFNQDGVNYHADGSFHSHDGNKPVKAVAPAAPPKVEKQTLPAIAAEEVSALLKDPRAEQLLGLARDELCKLVEAANGPVIVGEGSQQSMVAFIIKNTAPSDEL